MRVAIILGVAALAVSTTPLHGQCGGPVKGATRVVGPCAQPLESRLEGHVTTLGINVALGAATVGIAHAVRGGSFWKGAAAGALGGGLSYAGKRVVTADFAGSGLVGREIAALGTSVITSSMAGGGLLDQAVFPFGPLRFEVHRIPDLRFRTRVDVPNIVLALYSAAQSHVDLDWSASLSSGAFVFIDRAPATTWAGRHVAGVIMLKDESTLVGRDMDQVLRHERVHLLQHDFTYGAWGRPAQAWLLKRGAVGERIHAATDLHFDILAWAMMNSLVARSDRPSEREAYFLVRSAEPDLLPALRVAPPLTRLH